MKLHRIAGVALILIMAVCFWLAVGIDMWAGASLDSVWFCVLFGLLGLGSGLLVSRCVGGRVGWLPLTLYLVAFGILPLIDTSPVKPAKHAIREIKPGMTEAEVRAILDRYFPENGRFHRPHFGSVENGWLAFSLDSHDGRYNAAIVSIGFTNNRVVTVSFDPD